MAYRSLSDFLEQLDNGGDLTRIQAEVDPGGEIAAISARHAQQGGPAALFMQVRGRDFPVLTNLLATPQRICRALGVAKVAEAAERIARAVEPSGPAGWLERLKLGGQAPAGHFAPRQVRSAPAQQIVRLGEDVDLRHLPVLQSTPDEAGPSITAAALFVADPDSPRQVAGRYPLQLLARDRLAVDWADDDEAAQLLIEYRRRNRRMPVAAVLGGDPSVILAASALVPPGADTLALAGLLRDKALDVVPGRSCELLVPAEADFVIEGYVDPAEPPVEAGPLVTPLGYYSHPRLVPAIHVTAITHRANPIWIAIVPRLQLPTEEQEGDSPIFAERKLGQSPFQTFGRSEAAVIDATMAQIMLPLARLVIPELVGYDFPESGGGRHWAVLAIRKTYAGQGRRVASAALGLRQFSRAKVLVIVDDSSPADDPGRVEAAVAAHVDPARDVSVLPGPPDPHDPAAPRAGLGHKLVIDATAKTPEERGGPAARPAVIAAEIRRIVE